MFIQNKYTRWYNAIIEKSQHRKLFGYSEEHHITPRSLGGIDNPENIAVLTAKEHFICHHLLCKMVTDEHYRKMLNAFWAMALLHNEFHERYKITPRMYDSLKKKRSLQQSVAYTGFGNPFYGKKHSLDTLERLRNKVISDDTRMKQSSSQKKRYETCVGTFTGRTNSDETKKKIAKIRFGRIASLETKRKMSIAHKGRPAPNKGVPHSEETKKKIRESVIGDKNPFFGKHHTMEQREKKRQEKLTASKKKCPYCEREIDHMNYAQWHEEKCRDKK